MNSDQNLPIVTSEDCNVEPYASILSNAIYKVGDEVIVHVDGGIRLIGEWTVPMDSKVGIIAEVLVHKNNLVAYVIDEVDKFSVKKLDSKIEMFDYPFILEEYIQPFSFLELKYHNFQSCMVSDFTSMRRGRDSLKSLTEKDLIKMQMAFFEYGRKGIFPPEWEKVHRAMKFI